MVVKSSTSRSREEQENGEEVNISNLDFLDTSRFFVLLLGARGSEMLEVDTVAVQESSRTREKVAGEFVCMLVLSSEEEGPV